jgi:hypothetical protein
MMNFTGPCEPYIAIKLYRLTFMGPAVECTTTGTTTTRFWVLDELTNWCSTRYGVPDLVTAFIPTWAAEQYPTIRAELAKQRSERHEVLQQA